jgi:integrase
VRPYLAKHSVGRDLGDRGVDLETIADWYGHTDTKTTRIYTGAMARKLKAASEAINGRLGWKPEEMLATNVGRTSDKQNKRLLHKALRLVGESGALGS